MDFGNGSGPPGDVFRSGEGMTTRFTSGGVIHPSDAPPEVAPATGTARGDASGPGKATPKKSPAGFSGRPHASAGPPPGASATMNASNVGFRMLRNAGWNVGEGLGKKNQGATEPLRVTRKTSRRGVGGEDPADGSVSNAFGEARSDVAERRAKRPRSSEAREDASDAPSRHRAGAKNKTKRIHPESEKEIRKRDKIDRQRLSFR